jgi:hypothetical protein
MMPVMWFEQFVQLDEDMLHNIKFGLLVPTYGFLCCGIIIFIGILLVICTPLHILMRKCRSPPSLKPHKSTGKDEHNQVNYNNTLSCEESTVLMYKNTNSNTIEMKITNSQPESGTI